MGLSEIMIIVLILLGAFCALLHLRLLAACMTSDKLGVRSKVVSVIVPFFTPFFAWYAGKRVEPILWFLVVLSYAALRFFVSVRA